MIARVAAAIALLISAGLQGATTMKDFGKTHDGSPVQLYTLTNAKGASAAMMTYGATLVSLKMPDRDGKFEDVILGFDRIEDYQGNNPFFGATVGRYANRIAGAQFTLNDVPYKIDANERGNTLHSGRHGFDKVIWSAVKIDEQAVEFTYLSKDGDGGFPGNLTAHVRYTLDDKNTLTILFTATTDKTTIVNLANHAYFNLAGSGDVLNQLLMIDAFEYTPVDAKLIPTGKLLDVENTPFDFREPHTIGALLHADNEQLRFGGGYDHNFVLNTIKERGSPDAAVYDPHSGRLMTITTTEPGLQFYSGNGLSRANMSRGAPWVKYGAICLEPQHFPDSPHQPNFPSTVLEPGRTYQSQSEYRFSTRAAEPATQAGR